MHGGREVINTFIDSGNAALRDLVSAVAANDIANIGRITHRVKVRCVACPHQFVWWAPGHLPPPLGEGSKRPALPHSLQVVPEIQRHFRLQVTRPQE